MYRKGKLDIATVASIAIAVLLSVLVFGEHVWVTFVRPLLVLVRDNPFEASMCWLFLMFMGYFWHCAKSEFFTFEDREK